MNRLQSGLGHLARIGFYAGGILLLGVWLYTATHWFQSDGGWIAWAAIALLLGFMAAAFRGNWLKSGRNLTLACATMAAFFIWMGWDDGGFSHPLTLDALGPPPPAQAEESYQTTLWFSKIDGREPRFRYTPPKLDLHYVQLKNLKYAGMPKDFDQHADEVLATWEEMKPERDWILAMDQFETIGDLTEGHYNELHLNFRPFLEVNVVAAAYAGNLALEGKGDEAIEVLLPFIRVCRKLEPSSRDFGRSVLSTSGLSKGLGAARFVLSHSNVSQQIRAELTATLEGRDPAALMHRRMLLGYAWFFQEFEVKRPDGYGIWPGSFGWTGGEASQLRRTVMGLVDGLDRLIVLPRSTANEYASTAYDLADLAAKRDLVGLAKRSEATEKRWTTFRFKNAGGMRLLQLARNPLEVFARSSWEAEDDRLALLAELRR